MQRQDSLQAQLKTVIEEAVQRQIEAEDDKDGKKIVALANELGCYDAADYLVRLHNA